MVASGEIVERKELLQWGRVKFVEKQALVNFGDTQKVVTQKVIEAPNGANILPYFFFEGVCHVVLVAQFRNAVETVTWEAPGGAINSGGARLTMVRELYEETSIRIDDPVNIEIVFKEYLLPSLVNAFGWGGIVEIKRENLPPAAIHGKQQEEEFTLLIVKPLTEIIEMRKRGQIFFDLWTSRLINEVAKKTGTPF